MDNHPATAAGAIKNHARLTGAMYIPYLACGLPIFFRARMIVTSDPAATAARILASESLYRITIVTDLVSYFLYIVLAYLFYLLVREVSRGLATVATLFTLAGCIILIAATAVLTAPLLLLDGGTFNALGLAQREELALFSVKLFTQAYTIGLFLFGAQWLIMGPLFAASRMVPRVIGYWLFAGGVGWVALAVTTLLGSPARVMVQEIVLPVAGLAEIALGLWLLIFGGWKASNDGGATRPA